MNILHTITCSNYCLSAKSQLWSCCLLISLLSPFTHSLHSSSSLCLHWTNSRFTACTISHLLLSALSTRFPSAAFRWIETRPALFPNSTTTFYSHSPSGSFLWVLGWPKPPEISFQSKREGGGRMADMHRPGDADPRAQLLLQYISILKLNNPLNTQKYKISI
jgi:hypothetical protein